MAIEMTPKEYKAFQKAQHKAKMQVDADELGVDGLAETVLKLESKVKKLEKIVKGQQVIIQKLWAWKIECRKSTGGRENGEIGLCLVREGSQREHKDG